MSDLSFVKILSVERNCCEVFIQHYNFVEATLNPDLLTNETVKKAVLYAYLVDFGLYFRAENYATKHFEITYYEEEGQKHRYSGNFYDEEEATKFIEKVEITNWHFDTAWTKAMFEKTPIQAIKEMYNETLKSNEIFGLAFDWEAFLEELPRNFFIAKVFFKEAKQLIGFEKGMQQSTTVDTYVNEWL